MRSSSQTRTSQNRSQLPGTALTPYQTADYEAGGDDQSMCWWLEHPTLLLNFVLFFFFLVSFKKKKKKKKKGKQLFQADSSRISLDVRQCSDACSFSIWRPSFRQKEVRQWS